MTKHSLTKIVCTIGPASWDEKVLEKLIANGMNLARINASFADAEELGYVADRIRNISNETAILLDLMGHKIRVTGFEDERMLKKGEELILIPESKDIVNMPNTIQTTYPNLYKYVRPKNRILIDDGNIILVVKQIKAKEVHCVVEEGNVLKKRKTVNVPNVHLDFPELTEKDRKDIKYGVSTNVDYIAGSFIRNKEDALAIKREMGNSDTKLIAKIEDWEGVEKFDEILEVVDGIMIARGDMGVELPLEKVPLIQKMMIQKCRNAGKLAIVATQMLESMRDNHRPTRAEVSDVANAVIDGTDAVMLSAETSTGRFPIQAVQTMNTIANEIEPAVKCTNAVGRTRASEETDTLCQTVNQYVDSLKLKGVIVISRTGKTIESISRHRLRVPIWNITTDMKQLRQYNVFRGVFGIKIDNLDQDRDTLISHVAEKVYEEGYLKLNDRVAIISGSCIRNKKTNSILEITTIKDVLSI